MKQTNTTIVATPSASAACVGAWMTVASVARPFIVSARLRPTAQASSA